MTTISPRTPRTLRTLRTTLAGFIVGAFTLGATTLAAAPAPAATAGAPASPDVIAAFHAITGLKPGVPLPALDFSHLGDLKLSNLNRTDAAGRLLPWGSNDWSCTPSTTHPHPGVLVHGYNTNALQNMIVVSPVLKAAGYCVYTFNWGVMNDVDAQAAGLDRLPTGAQQLSTFVNRVLAATHTTQVDIMGHSAGGVMPRWYMNKLDGTHKVRKFFALAPATNGTDMLGLANIDPTFTATVLKMQAAQHPAVIDLINSSQFIKDVNNPPTLPWVDYTVLSTIYDTTVTPYTSQFLPPAPNVRNIVLQHLCPLSAPNHGLIAESPIFLQLLENILGDNNAPILCIL